jgi:hypothetical protein
VDLRLDRRPFLTITPPHRRPAAPGRQVTSMPARWYRPAPLQVRGCCVLVDARPLINGVPVEFDAGERRARAEASTSEPPSPRAARQPPGHAAGPAAGRSPTAAPRRSPRPATCSAHCSPRRDPTVPRLRQPAMAQHLAPGGLRGSPGLWRARHPAGRATSCRVPDGTDRCGWREARGSRTCSGSPGALTGGGPRWPPRRRPNADVLLFRGNGPRTEL